MMTGNIKGISDDQKERLVRRMTDFLPNKFQIDVPYAFTSIQSYWAGTVTNSSSAQISEAQLYLPGAKFALLKRDDNSQTAESIENVVKIGDLRPREKVQVSIWSVFGLDYYQFARDIRVTHRFGVGKITIPRLVTGFPAFLDKYDLFIYYILVLFFVFFAIAAIAKKSESRQAESEPNAPPGR
jgi:hypothetical protein